MKRKVYIAMLVVFSLFIGSIGGLVWAQTTASGVADISERWQTVYVIADKKGSADKLVVVDMLKLSSGKNLSLSMPVNVPVSRVKNYTDGVQVSYEDGKVFLSADNPTQTIYWRADVPYSQGILPFEYAIHWYWNGEEVKDPTSLEGKTGTVKLVVSLRSNQKIDDTYVPFLGMVNVSIDTQHASDVVSDSMPPMVVGSYYQVSGIVMALDEEKSTYIQWHTTDFQYPDIKIVVMPHFMDVNLPDMAGPLQELVDGLNKLAKLPDAHEKIVKNLYSSLDAEKVKSLSDGLKTMRDAIDMMTASLSSALSEPESMDMGKLDEMEKALRNMADALDGYEKIISALVDGQQKLMDGATRLSEGLRDLSGGIQETASGVSALYGASLQLVEGSSQMKVSVEKLKGGATKLQAGLIPIVGGFEKETEGLTFMANGTVGVPSLGEIAQSMAQENPQVSQVLMMYQKVASDTLKGHLQALSGLKMWKQSFDTMVGGMKQLEGGMDSLNMGIVKLSYGLKTLQAGTASLQGGADALYQPSLQINDGLEKEYQALLLLKNGGEVKPGVKIPSLSTLASGLRQMADGVAQMKQALKEKSDDAAAMVQNLKKLRDGLVQIGDGLDTAYQGTEKLYTGLKKMKDVLKVLAYGGTLEGKDVPAIGETSSILRDVATELQKKVDDIKKSQEEVDKYKEAASKYTEFLGDMKGVSSHVVFVIVPK